MLTLGKRVGNAVRLAEVVQILVKHGFVDVVRRIGLHEGLPAKLLRGMRIIEAPTGEPETLGLRLRAALTELGPTFVKFGQVLSTRPDLVGLGISNALSALQDRVQPAPFDPMRAILDAELGPEAFERFKEFNTAPVASASLSQVYLAATDTGNRVAVKIQRPGMAAKIESDLGLMHWIAHWASARLDENAWIDPEGLVDEFARSIHRELDFEIEARVIEQFRHDFEGMPEFFVPKVYGELSAKRVLTMDWVDGVRLDEVERFAERRCDAKVVAATACRILCRQIFETRLFHGDPHPGNIFVTYDNQVALVDYGMVGHLERTDAAALADLFGALFREDTEACVEALLLFTAEGDPEDREALDHEIADFIAFESRGMVNGGHVGAGIEKMIEILRTHRLKLSPRFSLLLKALATVETAAHLLDPDLDMAPILQPYVERLAVSRFTPLRMAVEAQRGMETVLKLGRTLPGEIGQLVRLLRRGQLRFQMTHEHLDKLAMVLDHASNRLTFGVIAGSLIVGSSLLINHGGSIYRLGVAGFSVAGMLGLALLVSILRSRKY